MKQQKNDQKKGEREKLIFSTHFVHKRPKKNQIQSRDNYQRIERSSSDSEEEFMYMSKKPKMSIRRHANRKKIKQSVHQTPTKTTIVSDLNQESLSLHEKLIYELKEAKKYRWISTIALFVLLILVICFVIFVLFQYFFSLPYIYIDQIQVTHRPTDGYLGIRIKMDFVNRNYIPTKLMNVFFLMNILDMEYKDVLYEIPDPLTKLTNDSNVIKYRGKNNVTIEQSVYIMNLSDFQRILEIVVNSCFGLRDLYHIQYFFSSLGKTSVDFNYTPNLVNGEIPQITCKLC